MFADDKILSYSFGETPTQTEENRLFKQLAETNPVLGVKNLRSATSTLKSIGLFSAIILDWQFSEELEADDDPTSEMVQIDRDDETFDFLMKNEIYSFVYVYSTAQAQIEAKYGDRLKDKYRNRIEFRSKDNLQNTEEESNIILEKIAEWESQNRTQTVPIVWSKSINQAVQKIFVSLEAADPNWIKEVHETSMGDGVNPEVEVVNLFQNLLAENVIQDEELLNAVSLTASQGTALSKPEDYAKLVRVLYYGTPHSKDAFMTGDILKFSDEEFGIIITPECDIRHVAGKNDASYEILVFNKSGYKKSEFGLKNNIKAAPVIEKVEEITGAPFSNPNKTALSQIVNNQVKEAERQLQITGFTQTQPRLHLLPCFEFAPNDLSGIAKIDFRAGLRLIPQASITPDMRVKKLNSPYIQELRQRYLAYKGRVGVPAYSKGLREWLLENK